MKLLSVAIAVFRRDVSAEWRRKDVLTTVVMFGLLTVVTFVFAFDIARLPREEVVPGCLWVAYLFAGMLGLGRSAARDSQDGVTIGLLLSPADRGGIFIGKLLSHGLFMAIGELIVLIAAMLFFDLDGRHLTPAFFLVLFLGTFGFVAVGTVFAVIGQKSRLREVMLPVLLMPVLSPLVRAAVEATKIIMTPGSELDLSVWLQLLVGFDVIFGVAGFLLYGYVLEE